MSTNCFHFSNHICGFRAGETPQGTSKQPSAKHVSLHLEKKPEIYFFAKKLNSALVILVQCSVICLPVKLSICTCGEWEEEGGERENLCLMRDNLSSSPDSFFLPSPHERRETMVWGWKSFGGSSSRRWVSSQPLTPDPTKVWWPGPH